PADAAVDKRHRLRCALAGRSAASVFSAYGIDADIAKFAIEEAVIGAAAGFAVGGKFQANALLQRQRVLDGRVLGLGEPCPVTFAGSEFGALLEQPLRAQEAADVLGAKRRLWLCEHVASRRLANPNRAADGPQASAGGTEVLPGFPLID